MSDKGTRLDFIALAAGLGMAISMAVIWVVALVSPARAVLLIVDRYHEGWPELALWCLISGFLAWRLAATWRRL